MVTAAERIIRGKGATNYAVGLAATRVIEAILRDENGVLPVSSLMDGRYGLSDVCLSLPSLVNKQRGRGDAGRSDVRARARAAEGSADEVRAVAGSLGCSRGFERAAAGLRRRAYWSTSMFTGVSWSTWVRNDGRWLTIVPDFAVRGVDLRDGAERQLLLPQDLPTA